MSDRQQIPIRALDATGTPLWEWDGREPYGYQLPNQDKDGDSVPFYLNLRMPGQWFDSETGLYHNGFRDYDPQVGRYIQPDPIGLAGGWNEYAYVGSDPVEGVDPYGLRDILVKGWFEQPGHVLATEMDGRIILNQYPMSNPVYSHQGSMSYKESVRRRRNGQPDWIFKVSLWDDEAFDAAVSREKSKSMWGLLGFGPDTTNCVWSVSNALNAGGIDVNPRDFSRFGAATPNGLRRSLLGMSKEKPFLLIPFPVMVKVIK